MDVEPRAPTSLDPERVAELGSRLALRVDGKLFASGDADLDQLLRDVRAGNGPLKLVIDGPVFRQRETPNRNFVRFKPAHNASDAATNRMLKKLAVSFLGVPFLADHAQRKLDERGGTVLASEMLEDKEGPFFRQEIELVKPWAIEAALDGTLDRFSIGWHNGGPILCSECGAAFFDAGWFGSWSTCEHMPGDEIEDEKTGEKRFVEMLVTAATGVETSGVSVPAVVGTGIEGIRAQLAARRPTRANIIAKKGKRMDQFKAIAAALGLAETATEQDILADIERRKVLVAANDQALATLRGEKAALEARLAVADGAEVERKTEELLAACRKKIGQVVDKDGKPVRGGTETEKKLLSFIASGRLDVAQSIVQDLPNLLPIGGELISKGGPKNEPEHRFDEERRGTVARLFGLTAEDVKKAGEYQKKVLDPQQGGK